MEATNNKTLQRAIEYVRQNRNWDNGIHEHVWSLISKRMNIPQWILNEIYDLMDEFSDDEGLPRDWWEEETTAEDIFELL